VLQQIPRAVTEAFPSELTLPPADEVVAVTEVTEVTDEVLTIGKLGLVLLSLLQLKETKESRIIKIMIFLGLLRFCIGNTACYQIYIFIVNYIRFFLPWLSLGCWQNTFFSGECQMALCVGAVALAVLRIYIRE
jgi:hypothetical protein